MDPLSLIMGGTALASGVLGYLGAGKAADQQAEAARQSLAFQKDVFNRNQQNIQPYLGAGQNALGMLGESYANPGSVTSNPDYQFGVREGTNALQNSAAARGGLLGGNFARGITQFGQDYGTNYLTKYRAGLLDIGKMGMGAATGGGYLANQSAGQIGSSYGNIGAAEASGTVGGINALTGSASSGMSNYLFMNALNKNGGSSYSGSYGNAPGNYNPNVAGGFIGYGG